MSIRINESNFETEVLKSNVPVILDFYSDSCIPCKAMSAMLGDIEDDCNGKVKIAKVNVNIDSSLAEKFEVTASPTLLYFIDGKETDRTVGMLSKEEIIKKAGL
mgnify:CR=1 FL=1